MDFGGFSLIRGGCSWIFAVFEGFLLIFGGFYKKKCSRSLASIYYFSISIGVPGAGRAEYP